MCVDASCNLHLPLVGTTLASKMKAMKIDSDDDEEVVPINKKKSTKKQQPKTTASAPRAPSSSSSPAMGDADFSKIKLRVMDTPHPAGSTTPPVPMGNKKRFHTTYSDGVEMVEEFDSGTASLYPAAFSKCVLQAYLEIRDKYFALPPPTHTHAHFLFHGIQVPASLSCASGG